MSLYYTNSILSKAGSLNAYSLILFLYSRGSFINPFQSSVSLTSKALQYAAANAAKLLLRIEKELIISLKYVKAFAVINFKVSK